MHKYPTNLTDKQQQVIKNMLDPKERFRKYSLRSVFDTLRGIVRCLSGMAESPSLGIIDSRSVRTSHHIDDQRGIDGNKKIKGRKEHTVLDTFLGLKRILADGGYRGEAARNTVKRPLRCDLDVVLRADTHEAMLQIAAIKLFLNKI